MPGEKSTPNFTDLPEEMLGLIFLQNYTWDTRDLLRIS